MWRLSKSGRLDELIVFKFADGAFAPAGRLSFEGTGRIRSGRFVYARSWLARGGPPIDPFGLPPRRKSQPASPEEVHLAFHDAGPDGWGKGIIDMAFPSLSASMPEYLALGGLDRTGDLAFGSTPDRPETWRPSEEPLVKLPKGDDDLEAVSRAAQAVEQGDASVSHLALLVRTSADIGGARPKARLRHLGREWIAKFSAWGDTFDEPRMEAVCLDLAAAAGIETPDHELVSVAGRSVLLVARFDRDALSKPAAYLSAGTLLGEPSHAYATAKTYTDIAEVGRRIGAPNVAAAMFRRLLVNAAVRNTDDHLRNHAFIDDGAGWRLSPVFDVVPTPGRDRHVCAPAPGLSPEPGAGACRRLALRALTRRGRGDRGPGERRRAPPSRSHGRERRPESRS